MRIYASGIAGDEPDMVRKMRIGQLQAAMLSMNGLQGIYNGVKALSYPLFIAEDAEFAYVLDRMAPFFEREMAMRGFKIVLWSPGGWMYFFTRQPVASPRDLRQQKLWVTGNPDEMRAWQRSGFTVVPLVASEVMTSLQGGMIDGMIASPLIAASNQWFAIASNMANLRLSPLWGALVVTEKAWREIPAGLRSGLEEKARAVMGSMGADIARADARALEVMKGYSLKVNEVGPRERDEWDEVVRGGFEMLIGTAFDRQAYEMALGYKAEFRDARKTR
jgi:TRAP-type C4-dicarboxylate transport system substrate-binding protein